MTGTQVYPGSYGPHSQQRLVRILAENWWLFLLRGITGLVLGIVAFGSPDLTLLSLTLVWGAYAIGDGLFALSAALLGRNGAIAPRWWLALVGISGIAAGILTLLWPDMTIRVLLVFIAAWALILGVLQIWGAILLRREISGEWLLIISGLVSIVFGVGLIARPDAGALAMVWLIGWYALIAGLSQIALALRLRNYRSS